MGVNYDALALAALPLCIGLYTLVILAESYLFYKYRLWRESMVDRPADVDLTTAIWIRAIVSSAFSLAYGWGFLTAFRTTLQAMSALNQPIDCSSVPLTASKVDSNPESFIPYFDLVGTIQITPFNIVTADDSGTTNATFCGTYFAANTTSTDFSNFNNIFSYGLIPLFNYCGTDLWETYSGAGVLNPNFATIIGAPIGAFGMFKGGIKKIFPRHVRNMDWNLMDIAGSRWRFLSYKLWTRHYTHIDPTREFEGNYFRKESVSPGSPSIWRWAGSRTLEGFTKRPHGEYVHGSSDDLMHLGPNETVVTDYTVSTFNAMLFRNGISSLVRSAIATNVTIIPILVVRQLQDRETVVDDTSYLVMQMWIGLALGYSAASVLAGWYAFSIWHRAIPDDDGDENVETLCTYNQTGTERYRMGTYYCQGRARFQNGFHQMPFQLAAFVQGVTSVLLSAVSALTLVSLTNAIIWIITHGEWNRGLQTCLWLPSVFVVFYRFLFVLPAARAVDDSPYDGSESSKWLRVIYTPLYNWLARLPQLSGQRYLTNVVYDCIGLERRSTPARDKIATELLGTHFLAPMRLSWLQDGKAIVKTTLHGGFYRYLPTKMLLEKGDGDELRLTFPKISLMDGDLLRILTNQLAPPRSTATPTTHGTVDDIDIKSTYLVMMFEPNNGDRSRLYAVRIPGEPWVSEENHCSTLHVATSLLESAPKDEAERRVKSVTSPCISKICVAIQLPKKYEFDNTCDECAVDELKESLDKQEIDDGLHQRYAIIYRQHPSKPYALLSHRRSGEVVVREIPGRAPLRSAKQLVCIRNLNGDSPWLKKTTLPFESAESPHLKLFFHSGVEHVDSKTMCSWTAPLENGEPGDARADEQRAARALRRRAGAFAAAIAAMTHNLDQSTLESLVTHASDAFHSFASDPAHETPQRARAEAEDVIPWDGDELTLIHMGSL